MKRVPTVDDPDARQPGVWRVVMPPADPAPPYRFGDAWAEDIAGWMRRHQLLATIHPTVGGWRVSDAAGRFVRRGESLDELKRWAVEHFTWEDA